MYLRKSEAGKGSKVISRGTFNSSTSGLWSSNMRELSVVAMVT